MAVCFSQNIAGLFSATYVPFVSTEEWYQQRHCAAAELRSSSFCCPDLQCIFQTYCSASTYAAHQFRSHMYRRGSVNLQNQATAPPYRATFARSWNTAREVRCSKKTVSGILSIPHATIQGGSRFKGAGARCLSGTSALEFMLLQCWIYHVEPDSNCWKGAYLGFAVIWDAKRAPSSLKAISKVKNCQKHNLQQH